MGNIVGIDLGTTLSVIAHLDQTGSVVTLPNREGEPLTASAIYLDGNNVIVGKNAKQAAAHTPHKVATFVKRDIGRSAYSRIIDGREFRPETLSAIILKKLIQDAQRRIGPISRAVITVPAYFDDARRKATEDAGRIAGLDTVDIINEPTAAALAYCMEPRLVAEGGPLAANLPPNGTRALVYDLGGGTFDVTLIRLDEKEVHTLATDGAVKLGGKDWDDRLVKHVVKEFAGKYSLDIPHDKQHGIANQAETAKKVLSQIPTAEVECFFQDHSLRVLLTKEAFEEMTRDLLEQTSMVTEMILDGAKSAEGKKLTWDDIDRVLLVGGSTRMPMVRNMLERITGKQPDDNLDADQVVARGAAIYANILASQSGSDQLQVDELVNQKLGKLNIVDVNAHSLGIEVFHRKQEKRVNAILIPKNRRLPSSQSQVFPLQKAGMTAVKVKVLEGEAPDPAANILLGECRVTELPPGLPAGAPVQVWLSYGANGRVQVMALDMTGGQYAHAELQRQGGLSEEAIAEQKAFLESLKIA